MNEIVMTIVLFVIIFLTAAFVDNYQCASQWQGRKTKWELINGCLVKDNQGWVPSKNFRSF